MRCPAFPLLTRLRNEKRHSRPWSPPRWPTRSWPLGWNVTWWEPVEILDWKFVVKNVNTHFETNMLVSNRNPSTKTRCENLKNIKCLNMFETNTYNLQSFSRKLHDRVIIWQNVKYMCMLTLVKLAERAEEMLMIQWTFSRWKLCRTFLAPGTFESGKRESSVPTCCWKMQTQDSWEGNPAIGFRFQSWTVLFWKFDVTTSMISL